MTNEIKEINIPENVLVALGDLTNGALNYYKATETVNVRHNTILDYITNLQEENKRLKKAVKENVIATCNTCEWFGVCPHSYKEYDYKAQIDKAIEYIINHTQSTAHLEMDTKSIKQLLDILRGDEQ